MDFYFLLEIWKKILVKIKLKLKKTAEATGDLIGSKIADKVNRVSKTLKTITNGKENIELDREIQKERYISPEKDRKLLMI